jgi:nicotinate-nucleotide pyrophosphorylase (carboxylating)
MTSLLDVPQALVAELAEAGLDPEALWAQVAIALEEDLPGRGAVDVTSAATIPDDARAVADFGAREAGVVAGLGLAALVFHAVMGSDVEVSRRVPDGTTVAAGDVVMTVAGPTRGLLTAERTALNFASHLSGVATGSRLRRRPGWRRSRAPARGCWTPARRCPATAPWRSTPCAVVVA